MVPRRRERETLRATPGKILMWSGFFALLLVCVLVAGMGLGSAGIEFLAVLNGILTGTLFSGAGWKESSRLILLDIRLPRVLLAALVGGSLSAGGIILQALLRNPLAEPFILGISSGSAVGAILAILFGAGGVVFGIPAMAFAGGFATILIVFSLSGAHRRINTQVMLLTGVIVSAFCSAIIMFLISITRDDRIHNVLFWLMGDFSSARWTDVTGFAPAAAAAMAILYYHSRFLNLIVTGEDSAAQMGVDVERLKWILLVTASLLTAISVSVSGIIGFVGLVVPHMMRLVFGSDHRMILPVSFFFGAAFLTLCDTLARCVNPATELPVGVVTALTGAPFFIYLLRRREG
jgi:iron complex transport system permease protein